MQDMPTKACRLCGCNKPLDNYYFRNETSRHSTRCKDCTIEAQRYKKLGVCNVRYDELLVSQKGACAICECKLNSNRNTKFAVDHDHKTGVVRGLLCSNCNTALGLMKDSDVRLLAAVAYIRRHSAIDMKI